MTNGVQVGNRGKSAFTLELTILTATTRNALFNWEFFKDYLAMLLSLVADNKKVEPKPTKLSTDHNVFLWKKNVPELSTGSSRGHFVKNYSKNFGRRKDAGIVNKGLVLTCKAFTTQNRVKNRESLDNENIIFKKCVLTWKPKTARSSLVWFTWMPREDAFLFKREQTSFHILEVSCPCTVAVHLTMRRHYYYLWGSS